MPPTPVVPAAQRPEEITQAVEVLAARHADLEAVGQELREATIQLDHARAADRAEYARAMDAAEGDPGPAHEKRAVAAVADAERRIGGEQERVQAAEAALTRALAEGAAAWAAQLHSAL